jgi:hypothetical protein
MPVKGVAGIWVRGSPRGVLVEELRDGLARPMRPLCGSFGSDGWPLAWSWIREVSAGGYIGGGLGTHGGNPDLVAGRHRLGGERCLRWFGGEPVGAGHGPSPPPPSMAAGARSEVASPSPQ